MNAESLFKISFDLDLLLIIRDYIGTKYQPNSPKLIDFELAILVVVDYIDNNYDLRIFHQEFTHLDKVPASINCACYGKARLVPEIKNTNWIKDRTYIDAIKPKHVSEMLLFENHCILEGTKSSFFGFVEDDGKIWVTTAPFDLVLKGTIAGAIVQICESNDIPFKFQLVNLKRDKLVGAFLTSSLRYVQSILQLELIEEDFCLKLKEHPLATRIRELLVAKIFAEATCLD